jgi:hypothetical protein
MELIVNDLVNALIRNIEVSSKIRLCFPCLKTGFDYGSTV